VNRFCIEEYREMLKTALLRWKPLSYKQVGHDTTSGMLWRHDIDVSLRTAVAMAQVDGDCGVQSNFFINIHSDSYNARSSSGSAQIEKIIGSGHRVEIHLDSTYFGGFRSQSALEDALNYELLEFRENFGLTVTAFSFHNPNTMDLAFKDPSYAGLVNCYSDFFQNVVPYTSDSNGYWRHRPMHQFLVTQSSETIQVLTHPEWWFQPDLFPRERMAKVIFDDAIELISQYDQSMANTDRRNESELDLDDVFDRELRGLHTWKHIYG